MSLPLSFFPPLPSTSSTPSYSLLTLTPALLQLLESNPSQPLEIRGHSTDNAVLVSEDKTWEIRGVQNSNSLCLCSCTGGDEQEQEEGSEGGRDWFKRASTWTTLGDLDEEDEDEQGEAEKHKARKIQIETILHETLEVIPSVARFERLPSLLKGSEYLGDSENAPTTTTLLTPTSLTSLLPASNAEITHSLRTHRVLTINGYLRLLPPSYLIKILPALLGVLTPPVLGGGGREAGSMDVDSVLGGGRKKKDKARKAASAKEEEKPLSLRLSAELDELLSALDVVDCGEEAGRGVVEWFATENEGDRWEVRVEEVVREVGVGVLEGGGGSSLLILLPPYSPRSIDPASSSDVQYGPQRLDTFLSRWKELCGGFSYLCVLPLLANTSLTSPTLPASITYLPPTHLSSDPSTRFTELFSLRPRWKDTEMVLFLDDLGFKPAERAKAESSPRSAFSALWL
ncbi:hypothetical protein BCR35DRAFT_334794 [Leucosporidium creatinivorum]|uniref:Sister chromatid cohesion protein Dcc1 n=1 Tax=Leucosporidium creatinivorum TaxID=106004 RepID=A0A1Y2DWV1_9BASI|nr:hypothetical protein BCR35DRAFT_334794 [Leucosporidium creatinivorum]